MSNNKGFVIKDNMIERYTGSDEVINIPEGVEQISWEAFRGKTIKVVNLPESMVRINDDAFNGCKSLEKVTFSSKLHSIGRQAFVNCYNLREVLLPEGLELIGHYAFSGCESLKKLFIPDSVKIIKENAFIGCSALRELSIPSTIKNPDFLIRSEYRCFPDFPIEAVVRRGTFEVENQIPRVYLKLSNCLSAREVAYIFFYQHKKEWKIRASKFVTQENADIVLNTFLEIIQAEEEITINNKNHVELFISQYQKWLDGDKCFELTTLINKKNVIHYTKTTNIYNY